MLTRSTQKPTKSVKQKAGPKAGVKSATVVEERKGLGVHKIRLFEHLRMTKVLKI